MSDVVADDYEFNYSVSSSENLDFYTKKVAEDGGNDGQIVNELAQDFTIERCFSHSKKNLKTLRKNRLITWLEWAKIKFGTVENGEFFSMTNLSALFALLAAFSGLITISVGALLKNAPLMIVGTGMIVTTPIFALFSRIDHRAFLKLFSTFPKTLHDKVFRVPVPYRYRFLYEELKNFDKNELTEEELKRLLEIASHYPSDVDGKIAKLMKLKRESKGASAAMLLQDADQMIEELIQLRESVDMEWLYEEMTEIFQAVKVRRMNEEAKENAETERAQAEKVSEIVSELANVSELLSSERQARIIDEVEEVTVRAGSDGVLRV